MRIMTNSENRKVVFSMEQVAIFCNIDDFCKAYEEYCMYPLMMEKNKGNTAQLKTRRKSGIIEEWKDK